MDKKQFSILMNISCLTVTQFNRIHLLRRCIWSFARQSLPAERRKLILVHHDGKRCTEAIERLLAEFEVEGTIIDTSYAPLGKLRNISIEHATGDLFCQWDDDDFYHPDRLFLQSKPFQSTECIATTLDSQFFWFCDREELYIRRGGSEGIHGSIMFRNHFGLEYDSDMSKGEDTKLIRSLIQRGKNVIHRIDDCPQLFVRTYHGSNTWDFEHHFRHTRQALPVAWLVKHEASIRKWISELKIPSVKVRDMNSVAFTT